MKLNLIKNTKIIRNKEKILTILYAFFSITFVLPSIMYMIENKTVYKFDTWFKFLLNDTKIELQTLSYIVILSIITILYFMIIKNRKKIFNDIQSVLKYVAIIGAIYIISIPFTCSDVFYYMGVGRIDSTYSQNPYYTTIKQYVDENNTNELNKDTVLMEGYINGWGDSTVVYGSVWQLICKMVGFISFGNVDFGLLIFKILNLIVHLINCWLIYKLTGKKIFACLYGLNPFILIEGIMCVHNDIFVVMFTLLAFYFMKKKKLWVSMIFIAFSTAIKYFSILLLPFIIIYYFRKEKVFIRFLKCIKYGGIFLIALIVPYLIYIKDMNVLAGLITQQEKIAKSIYLIILQYFPNFSISYISSYALIIFAIIYMFTCLVLLFNRKITISKVMQKYCIFLFTFLFALITQFQPWYLMWLIPIFMWQRPNTVKTILAIGIIAEFANSVFLLNGEGYMNGIPFTFILYTVTLAYALIIEKQSNKRRCKALIKN